MTLDEGFVSFFLMHRIFSAQVPLETIMNETCRYTDRGLRKTIPAIELTRRVKALGLGGDINFLYARVIDAAHDVGITHNEMEEARTGFLPHNGIGIRGTASSLMTATLKYLHTFEKFLTAAAERLRPDSDLRTDIEAVLPLVTKLPAALPSRAGMMFAGIVEAEAEAEPRPTVADWIGKYGSNFGKHKLPRPPAP